MTSVLQQNYIGKNPVLQTGHLNSKRYMHANSHDVQRFFESQGFTLVETSFANPRLEKNQGFQKHLMIFEHPELLVDEHNLLQLLWTNSHDGKSSAKLDLGLFRTICANGLVVGDIFFSESIRHVGQTFYQDLDTAIRAAVAAAPRIIAGIKKLQAIELTDTEINSVATKVAEHKFKGMEGVSINLEELIMPQRRGDWSNDAYTILNRLQEKVIRGGIKYRKKVEETLKCGTKVWVYKNNTTRAVKSIDNKMKLNKMVFDVVAEHCQVA